ncbi:hypothetical protein TRVL_10019 [Trypanosoma vivax]|nr:hypothetical protein TRVL_10019 [Trypanosoma vivax]
MGNVRQGAKAPIMNNSSAPQKIKLIWRSKAALLSKRSVKEGKRSPCNSNGIVGVQVYKALCVCKVQENRAQITIMQPQKRTKAGPKIKYTQRGNKISASAESTTSNAARCATRQKRE